ncbi:EF-hand domain-containing protein [Amycolatopsis nigrescens]|uniref:EF-hand domain-containing protein n=1 Tax=Amycolatopsis nigrescens TaxID=381445 RepID=UPI000379BAFB|nr:EF-hand domain-containing protein [Amycolatopsis nigrescens]
MTTAIANDRLKQRFDKWDVNGDGVLERADFTQEAERIVSAFGKSMNSPEGQATLNAFTGLYEYLATQAGVGPSGSLTEDQFIAVNEKLIFQDGESTFNRVLRPVMKAVVGLCDSDHNGQIDANEFAQWLKGIGVSESQARSAFQQIDTSGDGQLSVEELLAAVRNFHFGKLDVALLG